MTLKRCLRWLPIWPLQRSSGFPVPINGRIKICRAQASEGGLSLTAALYSDFFQNSGWSNSSGCSSIIARHVITVGLGRCLRLNESCPQMSATGIATESLGLVIGRTRGTWRLWSSQLQEIWLHGLFFFFQPQACVAVILWGRLQSQCLRDEWRGKSWPWWLGKYLTQGLHLPPPAFNL